MIWIEHTEAHGWEAAARGMRNPLNSWGASDSGPCAGDHDGIACQDCPYHEDTTGCTHPAPYREDVDGQYRLGPKDLALMRRLAEAGPDHGKFLRMITVTADITAPLYWWKEFDAYKVGTTANSCSTMYTIHRKAFGLTDFSCEHLTDGGQAVLEGVCRALNGYRAAYLAGGGKEAWWQMIQLLPSSYNQRRTVQLNYAVLRNIYQARKDHKLDEWREFCRWAEGLPYGELIASGVEREAEDG